MVGPACGYRSLVDPGVKHADALADQAPERQPVEAEQPGPVVNILAKQLLAAKPNRLARGQRDMCHAGQLGGDLDRRVAGADHHNPQARKCCWRAVAGRVQQLAGEALLAGQLE